ncbi:MAG: CcdB family protein [Bacteroidales bacterium]
MRQFDVHRPASGKGPLLLVLQADEVNHFNAVVAAPLYSATEWDKPTRHLQPCVLVAGERYVLAPNLLAAIPRAHFGDRVESLVEHRADILAALDFLFTGI